jgi:hypothetical protein
MMRSIDVPPSAELARVGARLVSDEAFREGFFANPEEALRRSGFPLPASERDALYEAPLEVLDAMEARACVARNRRRWSEGPSAAVGVLDEGRRTHWTAGAPSKSDPAPLRRPGAGPAPAVGEAVRS